jgi:hypothetical protein
VQEIGEMGLNRLVKIAVAALVVTTLLLAMGASKVNAQGLGLAPSSIHLHDVLRGDERIASMRVMNIGSDQATFSLGAAGEISDWVSFSLPDDPAKSIESVSIPGGGKTEVWVKFTIPEDTPSGGYQGAVYAETVPTQQVTGDSDGEEIRGGQAVAVRMETRVEIGVTGEQILDGRVGSIGVLDVEVGQPLRIKVVFQNTGNVFASPTISVEVGKDDARIDQFSYGETQVKVGGRETIVAEWDTAGREAGDYTATVAVLLGQDVITTDELPFQLLPEGTLTPQGELLNLSLERQPGKPARVVATFKNRGRLDVVAELFTEVWREGELVETTQSQETPAPAGEERELVSYASLDVAGEYSIKGYVGYQGRKTETRELLVTVLPEESGGTGALGKLSQPYILAIAATGVVVAGVIVAVWVGRRKRRKHLYARHNVS